MITLKIKKLTDRINGYGMPIVQITSDKEINTINRGDNYFECTEQINAKDLERLGCYFNSFSNSTIMLEILAPTEKGRKFCWYKIPEHKIIF
jgi:hypothetical protein